MKKQDTKTVRITYTVNLPADVDDEKWAAQQLVFMQAEQSGSYGYQGSFRPKVDFIKIESESGLQKCFVTTNQKNV